MKPTLKTSSPETPSLPSPIISDIIIPFPKELVIHVKYLPPSRNLERRMKWWVGRKEKLKAWGDLASALFSIAAASSTWTDSEAEKKICSMAWSKLAYYLVTKSGRSRSTR